MGSEVLKSFSTARTFLSMLLSWGLPVLVAMVSYVVVVGPSVEHAHAVSVASHRLTRVGLHGVWLLLAGWGATTLLLGFNAKAIYRRLEGYSWPQRLATRRKRVHRVQLNYLLAERELTAARQRRAALTDPSTSAETAAAVAAADHEVADHQQGLAAADQARRATIATWRRWFATGPFGVMDSYLHYPADPNLVMPTKLGNRLKAAETYSAERWGFDLITLWYELLSTTGEQLIRDLEDARHGMDNYVAAAMCAAGLSIASLGSAIYVMFHGGFGRAVAALVLAAAAGALAPLSYQAAVASASEWQRAIAALANAGRKPVAAAFGLRLPTDIKLEKHMWEMVTGYVARGTDRYGEELNWYRQHYAEPAKPESPAP